MTGQDRLADYRKTFDQMSDAAFTAWLSARLVNIHNYDRQHPLVTRLNELNKRLREK